MHLKLFRKEQTVCNSNYTKKSQVWAKTESVLWDKAYIKVSYGNGFHNDGTYDTRERFLHALSNFTEISLIEFANN